MEQLVINTALSTVANAIVFAGIPFSGYLVYHKWRKKRTLKEITRRAGLRVGKGRYLLIGTGVACVEIIAFVGILAFWPNALNSLTKPGTTYGVFLGHGLTGSVIISALIYGVIQTGLFEELLFRGLIAGSLARRLPTAGANTLQASIFLLPHLLVLMIIPSAWWLLLPVFALALVLGWLRIKSGSILASWLIHAVGNTTAALVVAIAASA